MGTGCGVAAAAGVQVVRRGWMTRDVLCGGWAEVCVAAVGGQLRRRLAHRPCAWVVLDVECVFGVRLSVCMLCFVRVC